MNHSPASQYSKTRVEAVIFDIDGTLYSNASMFMKNPLPYVRSSLWLMRYSAMRHALRKTLAETSPYTEAVSTSLWQESVRLFAELVGLDRHVAAVALEKHIYTMWIEAVRTVPLRAGMRNLLGMLRRSGVPLGILSDFKAQRKLQQWNIAQYFSSIICCEDYGVLKPAPELFTLCCKQLQTNPQNSIYVGNSLPYDGIGAQNAGLISVIFHRKKRSIEHIHGIPVVRSVKQLVAFLRQQGLPCR